jgi:hypothetical protein
MILGLKVWPAGLPHSEEKTRELVKSGGCFGP